MCVPQITYFRFWHESLAPGKADVRPVVGVADLLNELLCPYLSRLKVQYIGKYNGNIDVMLT
jgi:hypothetical protein